LSSVEITEALENCFRPSDKITTAMNRRRNDDAFQAGIELAFCRSPPLIQHLKLET
jgi:hypothetical protein